MGNKPLLIYVSKKPVLFVTMVKTWMENAVKKGCKESSQTKRNLERCYKKEME